MSIETDIKQDIVDIRKEIDDIDIKIDKILEEMGHDKFSRSYLRSLILNRCNMAETIGRYRGLLHFNNAVL